MKPGAAIGGSRQLECVAAMQGAGSWSNENSRDGAGISFTGCVLASLRPQIFRQPVDWVLGQTAVSNAGGTVGRSQTENVICSLQRRNP
jgi:hypothetical protein